MAKLPYPDRLFAHGVASAIWVYDHGDFIVLNWKAQDKLGAHFHRSITSGAPTTWRTRVLCLGVAARQCLWDPCAARTGRPRKAEHLSKLGAHRIAQFEPLNSENRPGHCMWQYSDISTLGKQRGSANDVDLKGKAQHGRKEWGSRLMWPSLGKAAITGKILTNTKWLASHKDGEGVHVWAPARAVHGRPKTPRPADTAKPS